MNERSDTNWIWLACIWLALFNIRFGLRGIEKAIREARIEVREVKP